MTDDELIARLRKRAEDDRKIQANNEVVAAALKGQRLLFDQGFRNDPNTYAVRLALDHDRCARNDAELAADWDAAADRIEALSDTLAEVQALVMAERERTMDACNEYMTEKYGISAIGHPVDRARIAAIRAGTEGGE